MTIAQRFAVYIAAGWSGFFVMGIELLGGRLLAPYFGSSVTVWGALIGICMLSLSAGYLIGGQLSVRNPSLTRLGLLLATAAMTALPVVGMDDQILEYLSYAIPDPRWGCLAGAALLFGVTTFISGMVSPYAIRLLIADVDRSGQSAGVLYFVSTLGSAGGTIGTTFYAVMWMELDAIVLSYIATSCVIAVGLTALDWRQRPLPRGAARARGGRSLQAAQ